MSTLKLKGSTSGYVELTAPATAGDNTITLPTTAGSVVVKDASNNVEVGTGVTIGSPSSNVFTVSTNGSERVRVGAAGSVGIGVTNPQSDLYIGNADGASRSIVIHTQNNGDARLRFREGSTVLSGFNEYSFGMVGNANALTFEMQGTGEVLRVLGSGGLTFNGDTSTDNALDDYEDGTWTPVLTFGGSTTGVAYNSQQGYYTKIGRVVYIVTRIQTSNNGTGTGQVLITGLPFSVTTVISAMKAFTFTASGISGEVSPYAITSTQSLALYYGLGSYTAFTDSNWPNNGDMLISGFYYTN